MRHCPLTYVRLFFENFDWVKLFRKEKKLAFFLFLSRNFQNFENPTSQFCSPTNCTSFHIKSIDRSLKTAPMVAIPVNPFCWLKPAKHDVTLTSLTADLL